jgi:hypothetical protein
MEAFRTELNVSARLSSILSRLMEHHDGHPIMLAFVGTVVSSHSQYLRLGVCTSNGEAVSVLYRLLIPRPEWYCSTY